jgi:hypothetical protein
VHAAVAFFSDIPNFFSNSKMPLLFLGYQLYNSRFLVIFPYFEKMHIIINLIDVVGKCIFITVGLIPKATNCCPDIISKSLSLLDNFEEPSFRIGVLYFDRESTLLKE